MRREFIRTRILVPILSVAAITIFPACENKGITDLAEAHEAAPRPRPTLALVIVPAEAILEAGETLQLQAFLEDQETGALRPVGGSVGWISESPKKAMVSATGLVEVYGAGEVIILATRIEGNPALPQNQAEAKVLVR